MARELEDRLARNCVTLHFVGLRGCGMALPGRVFFTFQFHACRPTRTAPLPLSGSSDEDLRVLRESAPIRFDVDLASRSEAEALHFWRYLAERVLNVDLWSADAQMHIGVAAVPLRALLRQGEPSARAEMEVPVVAAPGLVDDAPVLTLGPGGAEGPRAAMLQLLLANHGAPGEGGGGGVGGARGAAQPLAQRRAGGLAPGRPPGARRRREPAERAPARAANERDGPGPRGGAGWLPRGRAAKGS